MPLSVISCAIIATLVGLAGTLAIVIAAAEALHASPPQTASWVTALSIAMGVTSGYLSWASHPDHHRLVDTGRR